jgi:hypothetical protein
MARSRRSAASLLRPLFVLAVFVLVVPALQSREYAPRVLSPYHADAYSMKTFAQFPRWRELKNDALAWEVYRYLADPRTGLFPLGQGAQEGQDVMSEYRIVRDPVKLINVYGFGFCGVLGPTMAGVCADMGLGKSRTLILPGWHHVVAETYYDDRWHYLDLDCRAAFRRPDGSLASMAEAQRDAELWKGPRGPLFFPLDPLPQVRKAYAKTKIEPYHGFPFSGHTMDYVLRRGETFTRWWTPQGGRWQHAPHFHQDAFFRNLFERAPRGPRCKHEGWTIHSHGNGRFVYQPNLTSRSADFTDGVYDAANVHPAARGLTLQRAGKGHAIFEVRSPYVIVPLVNKLDTTDDDREASVVQVDATGATLAISLDNGLTWKDLGEVRGSLDLTPYVSGRYGYLLKLSLRGEPNEAVVRALTITTWVELAPASLPALRQGKNRMEYRTGDHHGLHSRVVEIRTNGSDRDDFLHYLQEAPKDFDPARSTARARGPFVVKVQAPPGCKIAWFSAGGNFNTHQREAARNTHNSIAYAVEQPRDFQTIYQAEVPSDQEHWHYNADREVKLPTPARIVYLRYVGDPGVNNLRIYAHCVEDKEPAPTPVVIRHVWTEKGVRHSDTQRLTKPGPYEIACEAEPVNESIELAVPSDVQP